jgi:hypothetical protein
MHPPPVLQDSAYSTGGTLACPPFPGVSQPPSPQPAEAEDPALYVVVVEHASGGCFEVEKERRKAAATVISPKARTSKSPRGELGK